MKRINTNPHIISRQFSENGFFPNSSLPVLIYQNAITLPGQKNRAATIIQKLFLSHNWSNSWRNGVYDFHHFHSNTHEVLGIASGNARIIFGGPGKRSIEVATGDVIIIPAGVGHKCASSSEEFMCVGAYPEGKNYDIMVGKEEEFKKAKKNLNEVSQPKYDPVFGKEGFIKSFWK